MPELKTGDQAPDFALPDQHGVTHRLRDYAGRTVLIYFYPRAGTPGCTTQSCAVRDARADWAARGVAALGISPGLPRRPAALRRVLRPRLPAPG